MRFSLKICLLSVYFLRFYLIQNEIQVKIENHLANFSQIWHKASLGELNLSLCKIIKSPVPFQRISVNISCKERFFLSVCLGFFVHSRIFHSYEDVTIAGEGLQILTYARYSWPLSSEGS